MRPELSEYPFDWMLWRSLISASRLKHGSEKEYQSALRYIPYFKGVVNTIYNMGSPGQKFLKIIETYVERIVTAKENNRKVAMTTFCFSPALLHAMDIVPVSLEPMTVLGSVMWKRGCLDYMDFCTDIGFSETGCSSQRGSMGAYLARAASEIDFIVIDSAGVCDTNSNAFSFAATYLNKPFYGLNYPATLIDDQTKHYHRDDYRNMITFLETHTGKKLDIDRLREVLNQHAKQDALIHEIEELQMLVPNPMPVTYNFLIYAGRFFFSGVSLYTELLEEMLEIVKQNAKQGKSGLTGGQEKLRAFFIYIDHYSLDLKLWTLLDQRGISHLGNILSRGFSAKAPYIKYVQNHGYQIDTSTLDSMIDSITEINARMPMVRSIRGPYDLPHMWLEESAALAKLLKADCCVYNGTPGCRNTWSNVKLIANDLEKHGFPTHIMYGDAFDERVESWEITSTRLEEFFTIRGLL
ncbi:MAG: 2-hydroxyacyl-CoA dehydratase [Desulfobacterales bacterium]|nr:2-hydroxyacyl-CoA dehydratase [Desulfobacterales bacterium]